MRRDIISTVALHSSSAAMFLLDYKKNQPVFYVVGLALVTTGIVVSRKGRKAAGTF